MKHRLGKLLYSSALPPLLVMAVFSLIFAVKGIYPFGDRIVDVLDMAQVNVPTYYHVWDVLRGEKSLFFDPYTGLGTNMAASAGMLSMLSPFNLFFLFIPRDSLHMSMGIFTAVKLMAAAWSMHIFLKRAFITTPRFWLAAFSVLYAFSGYSVMYYSNSQWLDIMAMFPLLLLGLWKMFTANSAIHATQAVRGAALYTLMMTLCLITNAYIGVMVLLFVFLMGGLFAICLRKFDKSALVRLGIGTALAIALSAWITVPAFAQINASARNWGGGSLWDTYMRMLGTSQGFDIARLYLLFPLALPFAVMLRVYSAKARTNAPLCSGSAGFCSLPCPCSWRELI
ncbi:MAG: YfhO family protein [Oscillospiraceae bacterium]|nr:YfhO family protein [Oscillospiraceae bacterium]